MLQSSDKDDEVWSPLKGRAEAPLCGVFALRAFIPDAKGSTAQS